VNRKQLRHIRRYEVQGISFGAWLYRIAHNELMSHYRQQKFLLPLK
jgi:DNA-directed RNA polymerase specialized sigma24 family protein